MAPSIMYSLGLPIPSDFEGMLPTDVFENSYIEQNAPAEGPPTEVPEAFADQESKPDYMDEEEEEEIFKRLKALGYIE